MEHAGLGARLAARLPGPAAANTTVRSSRKELAANITATGSKTVCATNPLTGLLLLAGTAGPLPGQRASGSSRGGNTFPNAPGPNFLQLKQPREEARAERLPEATALEIKQPGARAQLRDFQRAVAGDFASVGSFRRPWGGHAGHVRGLRWLVWSHQ